MTLVTQNVQRKRIKMREEVRQFIENKKNNSNITPNKENGIAGRRVRIRTIPDAERLLSKLIQKFQAREITGQDAKDLTYLLIHFVNIRKMGELETKINNLEEKMNQYKALE
jgi:hypothetical protein